MNDPNYALTHARLIAAVNKARDIISIGDQYGVDRPAQYVTAITMIDAIKAADHAAAPPTPPTTPKAVEKYLTDAADVRAREAARRAVTDELLLTWHRTAALTGLDAAPAIVNALVERFVDLLATFDAIADAPRQIGGHESPQELEAHAAALRAANALAVAVMQRAQLAEASGEIGDVGPDTLWFIITPNADTSSDALDAAILRYQSRIPQSLDEWDELRGLGDIALARPGEAQHRRQQWSDFHYWIAHNTADLGQRPHRFAEWTDANSTTHGRRINADANRIFAEADSVTLS